ncbi:hypothetical protein IKF27_00200 [Candidatus Saccharibacteria bacterium]|nr:hypothetical protein [Candidatus Saccharibacteria bacterium]
MELTIFKIAGWMLLIIIIIITITALVYAWPDIEIFFENLFSKPSEESDQAEEFKKKVFGILKCKGKYDYTQKMVIYNDQNITIYENRRITWKHKDGDPMKDCPDYIDQLYHSCLRIEDGMTKSIQEKARKILSGNESFQSGNLRIYSGERDSTVKIFVANQLVFCHDNLGGKISTHRPGKWEEELDRIFKKRLKDSEDGIPELYLRERATRQKEAEEERRRFSPIDDSSYF